MQAEFALGPAPCEALAIDAGNAASHAARRAAHADDDEALMSNYPTPESTADPADPDADSNGEDLEASIEDEGFVAKRPERRSLRPRRSAAPLLAPASAPRARPTGTAPSAKRDLHQRAPTRHSPRVAAKHDDLDEVADIVEIEDADAVDVLVAQGRSVGSERRRYRLLSKKVTHLSKPGKIVRARPVVGAGVVSVKKPAKPRTPSSFAAAAVEIYKPPQRTFHVRHHRTNKAAPGIMNIEEMTRLISPLASQSQLPSPPPDTTVDTSSDPRRYCTHLRKCWNEATLIEFDARGYVSSPPEARELFRDEGLRCIRCVGLVKVAGWREADVSS